MSNKTETPPDPPTDSPTLKGSSTSATTVPTSTANRSEAENITTSIGAETTGTPTVTSTQTEFPSSSANTTKAGISEHENGDNGSGSTAAIIGGCVGGVVAIVIVLLVITMVLKWKRRKRRDSTLPTLPDKDFIDSIHMERAVNHHRANQPIEPEDVSDPDKRYVNIKGNGETDDLTDPSVGPDGYLKKTKNFFAKHKHKKHKKDKKPGKTDAKRTNSMPYDHAPPPPRESSQYTVARIGEGAGYNDENAGATPDTSAYVNVQSQKKGAALLEGNHMGMQNNKTNEQSNNKTGKKVKNELKKSNTEQMNKTVQPGLKDTEQLEVYENVEGGNYYNLKGSEQDKSPMRQSTYENFETKADGPLEQDDVYENP